MDILLLQSKDKFFDMFILWLPWAEVYEKKLGYLQIDDGKEFISATFTNFCNKKGITIGYVISYMDKKNRITK